MILKNKFRTRGETTIIYLQQRDGTLLKTLIDTKDLDLVQNFKGKWFAKKSKIFDSYYVLGNIKRNDKYTTLLLHRCIMDAPEGFDVDHINHNTLDNRRCNLRVVTHAENHQNRLGAQKNNKSGILGVYRDSESNRWRAMLTLNGKIVFSKRFTTSEEAESALKIERARLMPYSI